MDQEGFLIIDKPQGWTSHDVVAKCRNLLGTRKIGHLGTLDPLATGVLVLAVGRGATKKVAEHMGADKEYEVEMELGKSSDTYDAEGKVQVSSEDLSELAQEKISRVMDSFWGTSMQIPPAFSAKKVNGKRAYKLARAGKEVELKAREVTMYGKDIQLRWPKVRFTVTVSSGTYVRSLVHDIGQELGCGAVMTALRRTRVGDFHLKDAVSIDELIKNPSGASLIPVN